MKSHRFTSVEISPVTDLIGSADSILSIGSCFAENMGTRLQRAKMSALANPLGVVYNPVSVAKQLDRIQQSKMVHVDECSSRADVHFHYDFHSQMSAMTGAEVAAQINNRLQSTADHLSSCTWLLLTLGTTFAYALRESGEIVANCHKMPGHLFEKRLLTIDESVNALVDSLPPAQQVIVTVSPVRHTKEGLAANQRSKARLIEVAHLLTEQVDRCTYFPAYELLIDELRDYRYFQRDLIHPTAEAVDIVWEKFKQTYFTSGAQQQIAAVEKLQRSLHHRPLLEGSQGHRAFVNDLLVKIQELTLKYPQLDFSAEAATLRASHSY